MQWLVCKAQGSASYVLVVLNPNVPEMFNDITVLSLLINSPYLPCLSCSLKQASGWIFSTFPSVL